MIDKDALVNEVLRTIRKLIKAMDKYSRKLVQTDGITATQILFLREIHLTDMITTSDLAAIALLNQSSATAAIDRLVAKKLVIRTRSAADKRQWYLELSDAGRSMINSLPFFLPNKFIKNFTELPDWKKTQILATLQHVVDMLDD